jgi:Mg2+ and Co2+ transporter CorA
MQKHYYNHDHGFFPDRSNKYESTIEDIISKTPRHTRKQFSKRAHHAKQVKFSYLEYLNEANSKSNDVMIIYFVLRLPNSWKKHTVWQTRQKYLSGTRQ